MLTKLSYNDFKNIKIMKNGFRNSSHARQIILEEEMTMASQVLCGFGWRRKKTKWMMMLAYFNIIQYSLI